MPNKWCSDTLEGTELGNVLFGSFHLLQGVLYLILALVYRLTEGYVLSTIPVHITLPNGRPGANGTTYEIVTSFEASPLWLVVAFFFVTGMFHLIRANIFNCCMKQSSEERDEKVKNIAHMWDRKLRWIEYSISTTLMIYAILLLIGISDFYVLALGGSTNLAMVLFGYAGDLTPNQSGEGRYTTFIFGTVVGFTSWVVIFTQIAVMGYYGYAPGALVFLISIGLFLLSFMFALNELRYINTFPGVNVGRGVSPESKPILKSDPKKVGDTRESVEFWYQFLSAAAKTLLGALTAAAVLTV